MAKRILPNYYSFNPGTKTIIIPNKIVDPERLLLITNVSSNTVLYNFSDPDLTAVVTVPYSSTGTRIVLNYNTTAMATSSPLSIMIDEQEETFRPNEVLEDPTNKMRVSSPQSLIDTDFEYGLQPIKWETLTRMNNTPGYYFRAGGNALPITSITGTLGAAGGKDGKSLITVDCAVPHNLNTGDIILVSLATSSNASGAYAVSSVTANRLTYFAKGIANGTLNNSSTIVVGGTVFDNNNTTMRVLHDRMVFDSAGIVTVDTVGPHGLLPGIPILVNSSTTTSANGVWTILDVPNTCTFRYRCESIEGAVFVSGSGSGIIVSSNAIILVRPESSYVHRPSDGGVLISGNNRAPGTKAIRQTRRYFRYQSGKAIQFSTGTKVCPTYDINTITAAGTLCTVTTQQTLSLASGTTIVMEGVQVNAGTTNTYNGTFTVDSVVETSNTVRFTMAGTPADTAPGGRTPQLTVKNWRGSEARVGFFDDLNGFYTYYDGLDWGIVQRNNVRELMGTVAVTPNSVFVTGTLTKFSKQLQANDMISIKGQPHIVTQVINDSVITIGPQYRGIAVNAARVNIMEELRIPRSQWNLDRCDGTGPSGYVIDQTKMQMFYLDYSWYGAGFVRWGFRGTDGNIVYVHKRANNNVNNQAYLRSGNLPARYEVTNGLYYSRFISASTTANGITLGGADTTFVVKDATYWPSSGTILVQQQLLPDQAIGSGGTSECMTFTGKTYNSTLDGWQLTGLTRNVFGANTSISKIFRATEYDGGTAGFSSIAAVTYLTCDLAPSVMHWGSSVIMDGGYDDDRSIVFAYAKGSPITVNANTSIAVLSIRLGPSVDNSTVGALGAREIINRMQLQTRSIGCVTTTSLQVLGLLNCTFPASASRPDFPAIWAVTSVVASIGVGSLAQVIDHTGNTTIVAGGEQIFGFVSANAGDTYDISQVRDLGNSVFGGDGSNRTPGFPLGPDTLTIVIRNTSAAAAQVNNFRLSWTEAQA
jgi:hypothetical protein